MSALVVDPLEIVKVGTPLFGMAGFGYHRFDYYSPLDLAQSFFAVGSKTSRKIGGSCVCVQERESLSECVFISRLSPSISLFSLTHIITRISLFTITLCVGG